MCLCVCVGDTRPDLSKVGHIHTYRHTDIQTYRHTYTHTYIHTCIHIYMYIEIFIPVKEHSLQQIPKGGGGAATPVSTPTYPRYMGSHH